MLMTNSLRQLTEISRHLVLRHPVELGDVYLLPDNETNFGDCKNAKCHPWVVVIVNDKTAEICPRTTSIKRNIKNGILTDRDSLAGLSKPGIIILKKYCRRTVELSRLSFTNYLGTLGGQWQWQSLKTLGV